jgi:membrane protein
MILPSLRQISSDLWRILKRMAIGVWDHEGYVLSGHLAYLALLGLFPFAILLVWVAARFGQSQEGMALISTFLQAMPLNVADALRGPISQVMQQSNTGLITLGLAVGVWTTGSVIETIRVVIHKAYHHAGGRPFWQYRLQSTVMIFAATLLMLLTIVLQFALSAALKVITRYLTPSAPLEDALSWSHTAIVPATLFITLYALFALLTPRDVKLVLHWPGALLTTLIWMATATLLPFALSQLGTYDMTYGSLAGVMVTLLFFYIVGIGFVLGAQLNAGISEIRQSGQSPVKTFVDRR